MGKAMSIMLSAVFGAVAFFVTKTLVTSLCACTGGWATVNITLFCTIFPMAVCVAVVVLVFYGIGSIRSGERM